MLPWNAWIIWQCNSHAGCDIVMDLQFYSNNNAWGSHVDLFWEHYPHESDKAKVIWKEDGGVFVLSKFSCGYHYIRHTVISLWDTTIC